jgi:DNA-directed RNA polymerase specialized sigma24 family protein
LLAQTVLTSHVDPNTASDALPLARKLDRNAVETVLRAHYPRVCRIALALCGRQSAGKQAAATVMRQSLKTLPWWSNNAEASNWFMHHTILTTREFTGPSPDASEDCLVLTLKTPSPQHIAFIKALRLLPPQQREAFLLLRGEHLDPRQAAVAMDCSTGAAANHLIAATKTLSEIAANTFDARVAELVRVYASLTPPEDLIVGNISRITRQLRHQRFRKIFRHILLLAILAALGWTIWRLSKMIIL